MARSLWPVRSGTILAPMALYQFTRPVDFVTPVVVAALEGWVDAAGAATSALEHLGDGSEVVVRFDGDELFDYRSRRPVLDVLDGKLTELSWPEITLRHKSLEGRDVLILSGPEPDFSWQKLASEVAELAVRLRIDRWISLGAIPAAVAHTRPVPSLATASESGLLGQDEQPGPEGLLRVPSAALSVIELTVSQKGIPAVGFYAQVPHYVAGPYPAASAALVERVGRHLGLSLPLGDLADQAEAHRARLDELVAEQPEAREYLERLESLSGEERLPSGDEIASELERFLRGESSGGEGPPLDGR